MKRFLCLILCAICLFCEITTGKELPQPKQSYVKAPVVPDAIEMNRPFGADDALKFAAPPKIHYPQTYFLFIGGNVSAEGITADLEAIAAAGFSGILFFHGQFGNPWPGVEPQITALSPKWDEIVQHTAQEAERLGLRYTMMDCSGWATAGGPWIEPSNAMRYLACSRTDVSEGTVQISLPKPQPSQEAWRDYKDIAILAFPTPLDDEQDQLKPLSVTGNHDFPWFELIAGTNKEPIAVQPGSEGDPIRLEVTFPKAVTVRTLEFPCIRHANHPRCYEPGIEISLHAVASDGTEDLVMHCDLPQSNLQDNRPLSLACSGEKTSDKYVITITNKYPMKLNSLRLFTAARKNNWESEAAWTLRSIEKENMHPKQNKEAYIHAAKIIDPTKYMDAEGRLNWTAPSGKWTILRIGHVNTGRKNAPAPPEGTGWECNKLAPSGAEAQFAGYIGRLNNGVLGGKLLDAVHIDSWECDTQTWTEDMESEFTGLNNYELTRWLPAILGYVVDDQETTFRFLRDWRGTINRLLVDNFHGTMARLAKESGLALTYETSGGDVFPSDILEYYKWADVPMCEFWHPFSDAHVGALNFKPVKPAASAQRMYGKPRLTAEAFTSFAHTWDEHWEVLREVANHKIVEGVTHMMYHTYTHNPQQPYLPPGTSFSGQGIGTPFLRGQTWWKYMPEFNDYFARCSYMMERGHPVSDIIWYLGDEINHKPNQNPDFLQGYKYDYCNPDILINRLHVENGKLVTPEGIEYRILWLADNERMLPETLEKIVSLVREGACVIGNTPQRLATLKGGKKAQKRFDAAVKSLWGNPSTTAKQDRKVGKGRVISGMSVTEALTVAGISPDVRGDAAWAHRHTEGADWYFVCPRQGKSFNGTLDFRCRGTVELWDPVTGKTSLIPSRVVGDRTEIDLDIVASGAYYVVFRNDADAPVSEPKEYIRYAVIEPSETWTLSFPEGWGAPGKIVLPELKAWKDLDITDEGKAFSGTAVYETTFDIDKDTQDDLLILDLGRVDMIAAVTVNNRAVQTLWAPPYRTDITGYVVPSKNTIRVEVTGTWFNRLVYDSKQDEKDRKTWVIHHPPVDSPLRESGLLGPVSIEVKKEIP